MEVDSKQHHVLLQSQTQIIVGKTNKIKINNFKIARDLKIICEEDFKKKVKEILDL